MLRFKRVELYVINNFAYNYYRQRDRQTETFVKTIFSDSEGLKT